MQKNLYTPYLFKSSEELTLYYTGYTAWGYYDRNKGTSVGGLTPNPDQSVDITVEKITEKAIMVKDPKTSKIAWLPKSVLKELNIMSDTGNGHFEIKRAFCYFNAGISWQTEKVYSPGRTIY